MAFIGGSANRVGGRNQAGFGCYYRGRHPSNFCDIVSVVEARAVLHVLVRKRVGARVAIALTSEYLYDGLSKLIVGWERDSGRTRVVTVAHADLGIQLLACMRLQHTSVRFFWHPPPTPTRQN